MLRGALVVPRTTHHAALLEPKDVGDLLRAIDAYSGHKVTRLAMQVAPHVSLLEKPKTRGNAFTTDETQTILQASLKVANTREGETLRNAKRWCPWLMAYSGARVNEITQLGKEDVFQQDGVIVMRLTPEAGTIKSKAYRLVPIHSHLLDQGFMDFVATRPDARSSMIRQSAAATRPSIGRRTGWVPSSPNGCAP